MKKILVIRNDKIGDFMLAWPSFAMLKQSLPNVEITALVPNYTKALAEMCPWIDAVMVDCGPKAAKTDKNELVAALRAEQFDASINLFSTTYNASLVWKVKIPYRLAPATKIAQIFYNKRIKQKRSQSAKPEFEYNLDLIRSFLSDNGHKIVEPSAPYLDLKADVLATQKDKLANQLEISQDKPWVFVHAGSGGSANNLSLEQYSTLIQNLRFDGEYILTAGPGEEEQALDLQILLSRLGVESVVYSKNDGLVDFTQSIACADLFIAGSTGPLHIAATLDVPTVGFFPRKRSATPLRWRPINSEGKHIAFCPPEASSKEQQEDMSRIDVLECAEKANKWWANRN
ncbi:ADP-heptose--lipooligosaccharide heptosyltransferase III [Vibrio nigripulchritudo SO65]|uniref:glycosyltransferase family 9 protein n=1 Tax=Vibrio nigripulchritudo TaxID=28173 RepID=UPI0003B1E78C|nr:glycosyltransferase family 9 protein [Vibrio nigripulchritudo]CCN37753.1 ADP-heptose--lipooligosaccharide heptosyltransferase III [Vibrio nigripulchritudo AM115]CCN39959.1 ADP-heptose--lipooligosaccharide heptosyltransferase III [Vibrio nigripulchritudo FTn2]CCN64791.1 ADP-heptose--lipooligosaccharide heptosyltransferase III [Vibrio nigripulchritudo POn4]CCN78223.1 ADP-heptose--lipooligosaccharide heptosyltransferase III [Vibrio nigripulchritudo SO65]